MANKPAEEPHMNPNEAAAEDAAQAKSKPRKKSKGAMLGWIISAGILAAVGLFAMSAAGMFTKKVVNENPFGDASELTTRPGALDKIDIYFDVAKLTPPEPTGTGAEKTYQELIKVTQAMTMNPKDPMSPARLYATAVDMSTSDWTDQKAAVADVLLRAADQGYDDQVPLVFPELPVSYQNEQAYSDLITGWQRVLSDRSVDLRKEKKYAEAEKYSRALLIFGKRLWVSGVYVQARMIGLQCCSTALKGLINLYGPDAMNDAGRLATVSKAFTDMQVDGKRFQTKGLALIFALGDTQTSHKSAGADLWNVAEHDKDRSWQLEAIMWMGFAKALNGVSEAKINAYLEKRSSDSDPLIAEKAKEARAFQRTDTEKMVVSPFAQP